MWEATYLVYAFHNVAFGELLGDYELTHGETSLDSEDLVLIDQLYNVQSGNDDADSHYDVFILEAMANAGAPCKRVMRRGLTAICCVPR